MSDPDCKKCNGRGWVTYSTPSSRGVICTACNSIGVNAAVEIVAMLSDYIPAENVESVKTLIQNVIDQVAENGPYLRR